MPYNMERPSRLARKDVDKAVFWYEVRLYIKVALIIGIPFALAMWALVEWANR